MKIAIIGAAGKEGKYLTEEAVSRGHDVTAIVRDAQKIKTKGVKILEKDLFDLTYEDLKNFNIVIDAFGAWTPETLPLHQKSLNHLSGLLKNHDEIRLLVVGGAGSLYVDSDHKIRLMDTPEFPDAFVPLATAMGIAFDDLKKTEGVNWTYLSPAADFAADGERTGKYKLGGDELIVNSAGISQISYADYAIAMIDEAENGKFLKQRFSVVSE
ncbi:NAD(P)-dependent oxidoreductase [Methanimicrococcus sp. OttesenSCG-928-J09]|nr:NAD(P)-dependent oxidoreductase [Methanimicrococcus sp. OttesenSCG-928-J09]